MATKPAKKPVVNNTEKVNEFMNKLDHPFKAEVQVVREIVLNVNKRITEEIKWKAPSFSYKGASVKDSKGLFNAGLEAKATRAIDLHEGDKINESALKELIRAAVALNTASGKKK